MSDLYIEMQYSSLDTEPTQASLLRWPASKRTSLLSLLAQHRRDGRKVRFEAGHLSKFC